ncbi:MAG: LPS export ABC transporter periplasmic protein LptC [Campylobacterota bacterium]|nr:LPS export ABC transporter periplasmic protein LptC [Campylobacterota bacterium]
MDITKFLYGLLAAALIFLIFEKEEQFEKKEKEEKPLVIFEDSIMYKINELNVDEVVQSKKAYLYKQREELYNATIVKKSKKNIKSNKVNTVSADYIIKKQDKLFLEGNVNLQSDDQITLKTDKLNYNLKTKVADTKSKFVVLRRDDKVSGQGFYLDGKTNFIKAGNTHFKVKLKENDEK